MKKNGNIKAIFLLTLLLTAINPCIFSQTTSDLEIKNTKPGSTEPKITITPQGEFSTTVPSEVCTITDIEPGALKIEKHPNNLRMIFSESKYISALIIQIPGNTPPIECV